jgi:hypothetical protein
VARPDWAYIPSAVLEEQRRDEAAKAWAQKQIAAIAKDWHDLHVQDFLASVPAELLNPEPPMAPSNGPWAAEAPPVQADAGFDGMPSDGASAGDAFVAPPTSGVAGMVTGSAADAVGPGPQLGPLTLATASDQLLDHGVARYQESGADLKRAFDDPTQANVDAAVASNLDTSLALTGEPIAKAGGQIAATAARRFFHGTGSAFEKPDPQFFDEHGLYGPGYYLTSDPRVAGSYAAERGKQSVQYANNLSDGIAQQRAIAADESLPAADRARATTIADGYESLLADIKEGPNVRPVDVPESANLLDADAPIKKTDAYRVLAAVKQHGGVDDTYVGMLRDFIRSGEGETYHDLYQMLRSVELPDAEINRMLSKIGYDGIRHRGGKNTPLPDDTGNPIAHDVTLVFGDKLDRVRNGLTGAPGGIVDPNVMGTGDRTEFRARAAGAVGGAAASQYGTDENTPLEERIARALIGAELGTRGGALAVGKGKVSAKLGATHGFDDPPDPRDFAAWMEYQKGQAARRRNRGQDRVVRRGAGGSGSMADYEKYLAEQEARAPAPVPDEPGIPESYRGDPLDFERTPPPTDGPTEYVPRSELEAAVARERRAQAAREAARPKTEEPRERVVRLVSPERPALVVEPEAGAWDPKKERTPPKPEEPTGAQKLIDGGQAVRYVSMLSDWRARMGDLTTGVYHSLERPVERLAQGRPREALTDLKGMANGFSEGAAAFFHTLKTGQAKFDTRRDGAERLRPLGDGLPGRAATFVTDFMAAGDDFFKTVNYSGALHAEAARYARRTGSDLVTVLDNPPPEVLERAEKAANLVTYQEDAGKLAEGIAKLKNTPGATGLFVSFLIPFVRVGANITRRGAEYTARSMVLPGLAEAAYKGATQGPEAAREALGKTVVASALGAFWLSEIAQGRITPDTYAENRNTADDKATLGVKSNSWDVLGSGRRVDLAQLGAAGVHAIALANAFAAAKKGDGSVPDFVARWIGGTAQGLKDSAYLAGIADALDVLGRGPQAAQSGQRLAGRVASSFVPMGGALNRVGASTDPYERDTRGKGLAESVTNTVKGRIPGTAGGYGRETLPVKQDVLGRPVPNSETGARALDPLRGTDARPDKTIETLLGYGLQVPAPPAKITVDGYAVTLTPDEVREYQRIRGEQLERAVAKAQALRKWEPAGPGLRKQILEAARDDAFEAAKAAMFKRIGKDAFKARMGRDQ